MIVQANKGLFGGLFLASLTLVAVSCYFVFGNDKELSNFIVFGTELCLLFMLAIIVVASFVKFQKMHFICNVDESLLDQSLIVIAVCGVLVLDCFHLVSGLGSITTGGLISVVVTITAVLSFTQVRKTHP